MKDNVKKVKRISNKQQQMQTLRRTDKKNNHLYNIYIYIFVCAYVYKYRYICIQRNFYILYNKHIAALHHPPIAESEYKSIPVCVPSALQNKYFARNNKWYSYRLKLLFVVFLKTQKKKKFNANR